jgi:hypothetical protein
MKIKNILTAQEEENIFLSKSYSSNQYDVNLLLAYKQMLEITNDTSIGKKGAKEKGLEAIKNYVISYCEFKELNFDLHLKWNIAIVIDADSYSYDFALAMLLIGFDVNRITALLNYQLLVRYKGDADFPSMVEALTYKHVKNHSPFDNNIRLKTIMDWVEIKRKFFTGDVKDYQTEIWFRVGVLFANGEMDKLKKQFNSNGTQIAKHLGNKSYKGYINDTIGNTNKKSNKNILNYPGKLLKIYNHCIENNIPMIDSFKARIQPE